MWISVLLVFGTTALVVLQMASWEPALRPGYSQMIHARIPWLLLGLLWSGAALGLFATVRRFRFLKLALLLVELPLVALASWYFLSLSFLPEHSLRVAVGDAFPAWTLPDQDGNVHAFDPVHPPGPALYIFYRGDW